MLIIIEIDGWEPISFFRTRKILLIIVYVRYGTILVIYGLQSGLSRPNNLFKEIIPIYKTIAIIKTFDNGVYFIF